MSLLDDLRSLDANDPGRWPLPFRIAGVVLAFVVVVAAGVWYFVVKAELPNLREEEQKELTLRASFEQKQKMAASFDAYRLQLEEIEERFGTMLRQLPGETEMDDLLVDISQTALAAGLEQQRWEPAAEVPRDFYAEKPIKITYTGSYHEIAKFVSDIAALPRIVTIHDVTITPTADDSDADLTLEATAKTYRYLDEEPATP